MASDGSKAPEEVDSWGSNTQKKLAEASFVRESSSIPTT
jgi:hypothetical protein